MNRQQFFSPRAYRRLAALIVATCLLNVGLYSVARGQKLDEFERTRTLMILKNIKDEIKKNYYDPNFHGLDLDARFKTAEEKVKTATSVGQMYGIIAQAVLDLNDSHTTFVPPARAARTNYGWRMQMIGAKCFVTAVQPGSDAEAKGLKPGDEVLSVNGFQPTRDNMWKMQYFFNTLRPQAGLQVVVASPGAKQGHQLDLMAKVKQGKRVLDLTSGSGIDLFDLIRESEAEDHLNRHRYYEMGDDLLIWKMPQFDFLDDGGEEIMSKARKHKALIIDLRGNPGGYIKGLQALLGNFVEGNVKVADERRRKETKPLLVKTRNSGFKGKLVILIDSRSGSCAEVFARMAQLEKFGTVIGDRSAGAVMESRYYPMQIGTDTVVFYGASITSADVIMTDGKSLEGVGVTPDELMLPTAEDMAANRDPVLARAMEILGFKLEPEKAGALFPIEWRK
ncbi:MAG TPA: S41 family peptidase [Blastocatellia bacterium]|nr:S41 family peptidase [Blastocatellia bacterium]